MMIRLFIKALVLTTLFSCTTKKEEYLVISEDEYRDKMKAAWIGQMAGVGWGFPTEFKFNDEIVPVEKVPVWETDMVNQHGNDDLYVEMTFLRSMELYGTDVSIRQAGIDFANSGYQLWAANKKARENLRKGIAPPESGHPHFSNNCEDIDYQIEADFSGIIAPGMPNVPIELGNKFGRLMNYGDGLYGGLFVGGMYASAYFKDDINEIIQDGLKCIPAKSNYAKIINEVIDWHEQYPENWQKTWQLIMDKYQFTNDNQPYNKGWKPIDAKTNGAFVVMGLLYGNGNLDSTIIISMRCGLDSDCNPSNAAGILATTIGYKNLPEKFKTALDFDKKFSYTNYNLKDLFDISEKFTKQFIVDKGGKIEKDDAGKVIFYINKQTPVPPAFEPAYNPGPYNPDNRFSEEELSRIKAWGEDAYSGYFKSLGLNAVVHNASKKIKNEAIGFKGKQHVIACAPYGQSMLINFSKNIQDSVKRKDTYFSFKASHAEGEKYRMIVNGGAIDTIVCEENSTNGWMDIKVKAKQENHIDFMIETRTIDDNSATNYFSDFKVDSD